MSWFFGKKKHKESPPDSPEDEPPSDDAFIFVEKKNQSDPDSDNKTPNIYPSLSNTTPYPPMPGHIQKQISLEGPNNDLTNIPFKFCKELEMTRNEDLVIDKLRLEEILSFISRVDSDSYDYGFNLERSVINELNSQNEE